MNRRQSLGGGGKQNHRLKEEKITPLQADQNNVIINNKFSKREVNMKEGFTLAEILITLGIIGVVAAMTLPTLIQNKQHRELETALKKNYSNIQNALNLMNHDYGETIGPSLKTEEIKPLFIKYFKVAKDCGIGSASCIGHDGDVDEDGTRFLSKKYRNYNNTYYVWSNKLDDGQFMLQDGAIIFIEKSAQLNSPFWISVDVNGFKKGPNRWGHDLFTFQVIDNGKLLPMGADGTDLDLCSPTDTTAMNGVGCTYAALTDKNYWKNLPK